MSRALAFLRVKYTLATEIEAWRCSMAERFCDKCGEQLGAHARFCPGCGVSVNESAESPPQWAASSPSTGSALPLSEVPPHSDPNRLPPRASSDNIWSILFDGSGKSSRGQFALVILPHIAIGITLRALSLVSAAFAVIALLYWIPGIFVAFVAIVRRFHDMGKSGWWSLLMLVPFVNFVTLIALLIASGERGESERVACPECHLLAPHHLETCTLRHPHLRQ